jgi:RNA polymerase sigma-70 factor (ECF subfamily)
MPAPPPSSVPATAQLHAWIDRIQAGDLSARDELLRAFGGRLEELARRMLRRFRAVSRWEQTNDVLQNALLRLTRALETVKPDSVRGFIGLAATQMRRELLDLARHYGGPRGLGANHASWPAAPGAGEPPPEPPDASDDSDDLDRWVAFHEQVADLPKEEREVMDLVFYQGLTHQEAAAVLGVSESTVFRRWTDARLKLRSQLREDRE